MHKFPRNDHPRNPPTPTQKPSLSIPLRAALWRAPPAAPIAALHARLRRRAPLRSHPSQARLRRPHDAPPECKKRCRAMGDGGLPGSVICRSPRVPPPPSPCAAIAGASAPEFGSLHAPPTSAKYAAQHRQKACIGRVTGKNPTQVTKPIALCSAVHQPHNPRTRYAESPQAHQPHNPRTRYAESLPSGKPERVRYIVGLIALQAFSIIALPSHCGGRACGLSA